METRNCPQSPTASVSSGRPSPVALPSSWTQNKLDFTRNRPSTSGQYSSHSHLNNNSLDDMDDDMYGSAAWRKKCGKRGARSGQGNAKDIQDNNSKRRRAVRILAQLVKGSAVTVKDLVVVVYRRLVSPVRSMQSLMSFILYADLDDATPLWTELNGAAISTTDQGSRALASPGGHEHSIEFLVQEARLLCGSYIYHRLCFKGLMNRRVNVAHYQNVVADELFFAGLELERLYPRVYTGVSRKISMTMSSVEIVRSALTTVLEGTFKGGITWAKIVSMMAISAAFAEECVVQGHPNFVEDVVICVGHFVVLHLTGWLAQQGGWAAFPTCKPPPVYKPADDDGTCICYVPLLIFVITILIVCFVRILLDFR